MLMRTDPFRELDRLSQQVLGTRVRPAVMPVDAYRQGDHFVVNFDLPGVEPSSIDLTVEKNVLADSAERRWQPSDDQQIVASERPHGTFSRQLFLGGRPRRRAGGCGLRQRRAHRDRPGGRTGQAPQGPDQRWRRQGQGHRHRLDRVPATPPHPDPLRNPRLTVDLGARALCLQASRQPRGGPRTGKSR